ncbi:MAG: hypothetical protein MZV63_18510 [Marinilabiliales bacterium]|nr:hypothetical protein [Marinilabiliales bacterium]
MKRLLKHIAIASLILFISLPVINGQAKGTFEVFNVSAISSGSDDMAPVILSDGILFCSNRKTNPFLTKKNLEGIRLYELYFAPFNEEGKPERPVRFATNLGKDANIGPASVTPDGNTLYFTRNYSAGRKLGKRGAQQAGHLHRKAKRFSMDRYSAI